jgi:hypothetical protein
MMLRWVLGGIACVVVGVMMLTRYFNGIPALDQLSVVEGVVASADVETQRTRRTQSKMLAVHIGDTAPAYYPERMPEYGRVVETVKAGERVKALVDVGKNNYIWQLDHGGERLVTYDQVAEAQRANDRNNALMGGLFLVFGLGVIVVMVGKRVAGNPPAAPGAETGAEGARPS